jgi:hypothetical protein
VSNVDDRDVDKSADAIAIEKRLEAERERIAETVEALAYKTDVGARTSDGIDIAKAIAVQTAEGAAVQALDLGARAVDAIGDGIAAVQEPIAGNEPQARRRLVWLVGVLLAVTGLLVWALRRRIGDSSDDVWETQADGNEEE